MRLTLKNCTASINTQILQNCEVTYSRRYDIFYAQYPKNKQNGFVTTFFKT